MYYFNLFVRSKIVYLQKYAIFIFSVLCLQTAFAQQYPDFTKIVDKVQSSVVVIESESRNSRRLPQLPDFFPFQIPRGDEQDSTPVRGIGSGFIIDKKGYILTNHHVVDGSNKIKVTLKNGRVYDGEVIGSDELTDIALVKIEVKESLKQVKIADLDELKVGSWVMAYGAPMRLKYTVTAGIVSALKRSLPNQPFVPFIQTDAAVNRGNSGGPLFNLRGEVVGVNSQIYSTSGGNIGISFAIPIDLALSIVEQLKESGQVQRGFLGLVPGEVSFELAQSFGLDEVKGALVMDVTSDLPADKAGIEVEDILLEINGKSIDKRDDVFHIVSSLKPGKRIKVVVLRDGKEKSLSLTIGERPGERRVGYQSPSTNNKLGMKVSELPDEIKEMSDVPKGVLVERVDRNSAAYEAGIRSGHIIQSIQGNNIVSVSDYDKAAKNLADSGYIRILIYDLRRQATSFKVIKL